MLHDIPQIPQKRSHDLIVAKNEIFGDPVQQSEPRSGEKSDSKDVESIASGNSTDLQDEKASNCPADNHNVKHNKRTIACTACHKAKVKCVQLEPNKPCLRCVKLNKECIVYTKVVKKKQKSSVQLTQYENQIKLLTAKVKEQQIQINLLKSDKDRSIDQDFDGEEIFEDIHTYFKNSNGSQNQSLPEHNAKLKQLQEIRKKAHYKSSISYYLNLRSKEELLLEYSIMLDLKLQRYFTVPTNFTLVGNKRDEILKLDYHKETDVVGQRLLTQEEINYRLKYYMEKMYPLYGIVSILDSNNQKIFPSEILRRRSPFLYMAILAISSITISKTDNRSNSLDTHLRLNVKSIELIIHEIMVVGSKSIELLQALLLMSLWYDSAELLQHRRYHLMNMLCVSLMEELGLNGKTIFYFSKAESIAKRAPLVDISQLMQSRKLALAVYSSNICYSIFLKRESMLKWNSYFEECCTILFNSENANHRKIAIFAKLNHCLERIYSSLHHKFFDLTNLQLINDRSNVKSQKELMDEKLKKEKENQKINSLITNFHDLLMKIKSKISADNKFCLVYYYSVEAYLFEPFTHKILEEVEENAKEEDVFDKLRITPFVIAKINNCAASCMNAFRVYHEFSNDVLSCLPLTIQSRVFYLSGTLLRLRYLITLINDSYQSKLKHQRNLIHKNDAFNNKADDVQEQKVVFLNTLISLPEDLLEKLLENLERNYTASNEYPYNYFLPKSRLMLILYLLTYSNQIMEALGKKYQVDKKAISDYLKSEGKSQKNKIHSKVPKEKNLEVETANIHKEDAQANNFQNLKKDTENLKKIGTLVSSIINQPGLSQNAPETLPESHSTELPSSGRKSHQELLNNINILNFLFDNTGTANNVGIDTPPENISSATPPTMPSPSPTIHIHQNKLGNNSVISNSILNIDGSNSTLALSSVPNGAQNLQALNGSSALYNSELPISSSSYFPNGSTSNTNVTSARNLTLPPLSNYPTSDEYSFWALNDNMWNDLLMGVDFGMLRGPSNSNTGSNGFSTPSNRNSATESVATMSSGGKSKAHGSNNSFPVESPVSSTEVANDEISQT